MRNVIARGVARIQARLSSDARAGITVPGAREGVAGRALDEIAAAVVGVARKGLFDVAEYRGNPAFTQEGEAVLRLGAIARHVPGADHALRADAEARRLGEQGVEGIQVRQHPAEDEDRTIEVAEVAAAGEKRRLRPHAYRVGVGVSPE
jgi:hypothetical protein